MRSVKVQKFLRSNTYTNLSAGGNKGNGINIYLALTMLESLINVSHFYANLSSWKPCELSIYIFCFTKEGLGIERLGYLPKVIHCITESVLLIIESKSGMVLAKGKVGGGLRERR